MRILTTLTAATALAGFTTAAMAGGLSPEIMEAPVVAAEPAPAPGSSINPAFVVIGVLAALLIASSSSSSDGDGAGTGDIDQMPDPDSELVFLGGEVR